MTPGRAHTTRRAQPGIRQDTGTHRPPPTPPASPCPAAPTRCSPRTTHARSAPPPRRSLADGAVDAFADEVGVAVVAGGVLRPTDGDATRAHARPPAPGAAPPARGAGGA